MSEPAKKDEKREITGPQWIQLKDNTIDQIQESISKDLPKGVKIQADRSAIYYPPIDGKRDPLSLVHYDILAGVSLRQSNSSKEMHGLVIGEVGLDKGDRSIIYFLTLVGKADVLNSRDAIIAEANNQIAVLGGNKFIPRRT